MSEKDAEQSGGTSGADLIGRERIRGASRVIAEGTAPENVTREQVLQVAADVEAFRMAYGLSQKEVADKVGYTHGSISRFLIGSKDESGGERIAIELDSWLVSEEQKRARPSTTQFTWTNGALVIKSVANYVLDHSSIGLVYGPETSGMGKTTAMQAYCEETGPRRCAMIRIDKVDASATAIMRKLAGALKVSNEGGNSRIFNRCVEKLKGRSHILLCDQIHNLRWAKNDRPLYILTDLHDATKTAQLWTGTSDVVAYLDRQRVHGLDESLAQIKRRIYPCVDLIEALGPVNGGTGRLLVSIAQVREIFAKNQLRITGASERFLATLCNTPDSGSIGLAVRLVEYATMLAGTAQHHAEEIDVPLLIAALRCCVSSARAELLINDLDHPETFGAVAQAG